MWRMRSDRIAAITARNERPFSPKHATMPKAARAAPARSGPITRARLNWIELSAMAFGRCCLVHERGNERLIRRPAKRLGQAGDDRQRQHVPDADDIQVDERSERERRGHLDALRHDEQLPAIAPVGDHAPDQREEQDRRFAEERIEAEIEGRRAARDGEHEPALRDLLHPRADARREGADPQHPEITVDQGGGESPERGRRGFDGRLKGQGHENKHCTVPCACRHHDDVFHGNMRVFAS